MIKPSLFVLLGAVVLIAGPIVSFAQSNANASQEIRELRAKAESGDAVAQFNLALMYYNGEGVPENAAEAYSWWNLAAAQGQENARSSRDEVEKFLSREQIAEAQRRSAAWKKTEK
jgi:TPR repeat protein